MPSGFCRFSACYYNMCRSRINININITKLLSSFLALGLSRHLAASTIILYLMSTLGCIVHIIATNVIEHKSIMFTTSNLSFVLTLSNKYVCSSFYLVFLWWIRMQPRILSLFCFIERGLVTDRAERMASVMCIRLNNL